MYNKYYVFRTEKEFNQITNFLNSKGYIQVGTNKATFNDVKNHFKRNKIFLVNAFYNSINHKLEYQFTTHQVELTYGIKINDKGEIINK